MLSYNKTHVRTARYYENTCMYKCMYIFRQDVQRTAKNSVYGSVWQLHGLASVVGCSVHSVYPEDNGLAVRTHLHRLVQARRERLGKTDCKIMCNSSVRRSF